MDFIMKEIWPYQKRPEKYPPTPLLSFQVNTVGKIVLEHSKETIIYKAGEEIISEHGHISSLS